MRCASKPSIETSPTTIVCLAVDPELFVEALGKASYVALTVSVSKARELIGEQDLQAISEATTTPALRIEPRNAAVA